MKSLLRSRQAQSVLPYLLSCYLTVALRTTRWTLEGQEHLARTSLVLRLLSPSGMSFCR